MPKVTESQVQEPAPKGVAYPDMKSVGRWAGSKHGLGGITGPEAKLILDLEDEEEHAARVCKENNIAPANGKLPKIEMKRFLITESGTPWVNCRGLKVMAWNNTHNRGVNKERTDGYRQSVLMRQWAGPTTFPGETVNGETISISRTEQIISGQKRLLAVYDAWLDWLDNPEKWLANWPKEQYPDGPVLESLLVYGVSDDLRVVQSVDDVQIRSEADIFSIGGAVEKMFGDADAAKLSTKQRAEASRMLQTAVDFLWDRLRMSDVLHHTNAAGQQFLADHPKLHRAVRHIFDENGQDAGRPISIMRLSPGQCSAMLYLMAAGKTNGGLRQPTEEELDVSLWKKAEEFWAETARKQGGFKVLADVLSKTMDPDEGSLAVRRCCIVAKAWAMFSGGGKITADALKLDTVQDDNGRTHFVDPPDFGGCDRGPKLPKSPEENGGDPTPEQVAAKAANIKAENARLLKQKAEAAKANPQQKPKALTPTPTTAKPAAATSGKAPVIKISTGTKPNGKPGAAKPKPVAAKK